MKDLKALIIMLIILFVILFVLIFSYIYQDYKNLNSADKFIDISKIQEEIELDVKEKEQEETEILEMEPAPTQLIDNTNENDYIINSNSFYYNQLDSYSKIIYKSLEEQKENLKSGIETIYLPEKIKNIIEEENVEEIFSTAINAVEYDYPEMYYIDMSKLILYYEKYSTGSYKIYLKKDDQYQNYLMDGFYSEQDIEMAQEEINNVVQEIQSNIEKLETDYDKILYIHDWIIENIEYDETLNRANRNNIYGAFIEKRVTCGGYAKAFKYLVDKLNIECIIIQGKASTEEKTENHAWNYIRLSNKWYGIDCTWDDPIIIGKDENQIKQKYYTYFLKGQEVFKNHIPFETFGNTDVKLNYPVISNTDYNK